MALDVRVLVVQLSPPRFHRHQRDAHAVHARVFRRALLPEAPGLLLGLLLADNDDATPTAATGSTRAIGVGSRRVRNPTSRGAVVLDGLVRFDVPFVHVVARVLVHELMRGEQGSRRGPERHAARAPPPAEPRALRVQQRRGVLPRLVARAERPGRRRVRDAPVASPRRKSDERAHLVSTAASSQRRDVAQRPRGAPHRGPGPRNPSASPGCDPRDERSVRATARVSEGALRRAAPPRRNRFVTSRAARLARGTARTFLPRAISHVLAFTFSVSYG